LVKRFTSNAASRDRRSLGFILLSVTTVVLGILASHGFPSFEMSSREAALKFGVYLFGAGLALRWFAVVYLGRLSSAVAIDPRLIDSGPYRFVSYLGYAGALLALSGFGVTFHNWVSLLVIFASGCAIGLWRMQGTPQSNQATKVPG
jgi:protein-S-isoprenylcysteine O-methyltransferase Ste14